MTDTRATEPNWDDLSFTDTDVDSLAKKYKIPREGWFKFMARGHKRETSKKGNLMLYLSCSPLDKDDQPASVSTRLRIMPPIPNPAVEGHTAPNTKLGCWFFAMALDSKFPRYPKKNGDGTFTTTEGEIVDVAGKKAIEREVDKAIIKTSVDWLKDPDALVDEVFYGKVVHEVGTDDNTYASIERTRFDAPEDEPVIYEDFVAK